jgi:Ca2+:H+ antiporter
MNALFASLGEGDAPDPQDGSLRGLLTLSRGTSIILLGVYIAYLHFQVRFRSFPGIFATLTERGLS